MLTSFRVRLTLVAVVVVCRWGRVRSWIGSGRCVSCPTTLVRWVGLLAPVGWRNAVMMQGVGGGLVHSSG